MLVVFASCGSMSNYSALRVAQLRDMCMQRGIDCASMRKREMIEALRFDDDNSQYFFGAVLPSVLVLRKADKLVLRYQCLEYAFCTYCRSI